MLVQQILLKIFHKLHRERTVSGAFHLLKGKRSGQTIQDVGIFKLYAYFGILPKLSRANFERELDLLLAQSFIILRENGYYELTEKGIEQAMQPFDYEFDGWHYRGNEHLFFARLSLVIQSLSHQIHDIRAFIPIEKNEKVQRWVRGFLVNNHYRTKQLQPKLIAEIEQSIHMTSLDDSQKELIISRLTGYKLAGLTWQQLAFHQKRTERDVQLCYISALHNWLNVLYGNSTLFPLLSQMMQNVRVEIPLTGSAFQTAQLFKQGHTIEQISAFRRLKSSTVEDHIVELAMNDTEFELSQFVSLEDATLVRTAIEDYNTRKLKVLHEVVSHLSFFQLRLVLAKGDDVR